MSFLQVSAKFVAFGKTQLGIYIVRCDSQDSFVDLQCCITPVVGLCKLNRSLSQRIGFSHGNSLSLLKLLSASTKAHGALASHPMFDPPAISRRVSCERRPIA